MPDEADSPLAFATADELINELASRSDGLVIAALFKADDRDTGQSMTFRYTGGIWQAIGLLSHAQSTLKDQIDNADPDED